MGVQILHGGSGAAGVGAFVAPNASTVPLSSQGAAGQTADLFDTLNSAGTKLAYVDNVGGIHVAAGQPFWLDSAAFFATDGLTVSFLLDTAGGTDFFSYVRATNTFSLAIASVTPFAFTPTAATLGVKLYPVRDTGATQAVTAVYAGNGAPNNANGANGDFYLRGDGAAGTFIYHKAAGAWVGIV